MSRDYLVHWADATAKRIIQQLGDKDQYVVASGITPSGVVHFGNFREVMTVDLVSRALKDQGKKSRFIFSWDDYDTFRKVPLNMPKQEELKKYMYQPIVDTPDPFETNESYADHNEKAFMSQLDKVGVEVEPLYQAKKYRAKEYNKAIKLTLKNTDVIKNILNQYRKEPLADSWLPLSVYCTSCNRDRIKSMSYDGEDTLSYECELCGHKENLSVDNSDRLKLPWRMDWPMRWAHEQVDFEPGGKDHSSEGGSFSTGKEIVKEVYDFKAPIYLQYDFVSIKGRGGKMSSSSGDVITVNDVLDVYTPQMVRYIFASYKSNVDFSVSFDLDVLKVYEDFDKMERLAFGIDQGNEKKVKMAKRVYELSLTEHRGPVDFKPENAPFRPALRHLCNILQINEGDIEASKTYYQSEFKNASDEKLFNQRAKCAWHWITNFAPEDFRFGLRTSEVNLEINDTQKSFISKLKSSIDTNWDKFATDKDLHEEMYRIIHEVELKPADVFPVVYKLLIEKEKGPKLAGFIRSIGKEKVLELL